MFKKHPRGQSVKEPTIGDVVQVKDSSPRGTWRVGYAIEMIRSQDGRARGRGYDAQQEYLTKTHHISLSFGM